MEDLLQKIEHIIKTTCYGQNEDEISGADSAAEDIVALVRELLEREFQRGFSFSSELDRD